MDTISSKLQAHYQKTFQEYGMTSQGVDWGDDSAKLELRYSKMLAIVKHPLSTKASFLDVGCGYGGLFEYEKTHSVNIDYTGVDVVKSMIDKAELVHDNAKFIHSDILDSSFKDHYDYVVCNGILTQKLDVPALEMDQFAAKLIRKMFEICRVGIAFNIMTTKVNFYSNNLYYRNPSEMLAWCMSELSSIVMLDHSYPMYEYTLYVYKEHK